MKKSMLQKNPKSKVLKSGYINIYSELNAKEKKQHYFKTLYKEKNLDWDETLVYLSKRFKDYIGPNLKVLDAGCGHGNYVIDENRRDISYAVGVDISKDATQKNICLDEIKIGDLEDMPFKDNFFDIVICLWVFEHLKDPKKVFKEVSRVLNLGGIFLFAAPNKKFFPLFLVNLIRYSPINFFLNQKLFGRHKNDIFDAYYLANDVSKIKKLCLGLFDVEELYLNYDPSYTSFGKVSFILSNVFHNLISLFGFTFTFPHIIGILRRKS